MRIKCSSKSTRSLGLKGRTAVFDEDGFATVAKELGTELAAAYPDHVEVVKEKSTRNQSTEE